MTTIEIILLCANFLVYLYIFVRRFIHSSYMLQLERYQMMKFVEWFYHNKANKTVLIPALTSVLSLIFVLFISFNKLIILELILGLVTIPFINYRQEKKKFNVTSRVKRMFLFSGLLVLILFGLTYFFCISRFTPIEICFIFLLILNFMVFDLVLLSEWVSLPFEKMIQNKYIQEARTKIKSLRDLNVIGITGSYGKTSTKFIIRDLLSKEYNVCATPESYNTPMGVTLTINNYLKNIDEYFICEMGACRVGDIKELCDIATPKIGIITSIGPQHLETFGNIKNIINTKYELVESLPKEGLAILNYDNYYIRNYFVKNPVKVLTYGIEQEQVDYYALNIKYGSFGSTFEVQYPNGERYLFKTKLLGKHNISNLLAGIALSDYLNLDIEKVKMSIEQINPVPHRLELKNLPNYNIIDDSFNANVEGVHNALEILNQFNTHKIIITPGLIELGEAQYEHNYRLGEQIAEACDYVVLVGKKQTKPIFDALEDLHYPKEQIYVTNVFKEGMNHLVTKFKKDFTVLIENDLPDNYSER